MKAYFKSDDPFYSIYNVGPYSLSKWKVVWNRIDTKLQSVVVDSHNIKNSVQCQETHTFVGCESKDEAMYFSALFNSAPADLLVRCYSISKGFASAHVLESISIPRFKHDNLEHMQLADLSEQCHQAAALGNTAALADLQAQVDAAAATLWNIDGSELAAIHQALEDMKKVKPAAKAVEEDVEDGAEE